MMILFKQLKIKSLTKKLKVMQRNRLNNQPSDAVLAKEIALAMQLAGIYKSCLFSKKYPFAELMMQECLRTAAALDYPRAQYELGGSLLEEAKYRESLEVNAIFASPSNKQQSERLFQEAHAYLFAASKLEHVMAKRMLGLCYINAWGVEMDKKKGFDWVVESIEQEGSWDKIPQIFLKIGLNKPEFFSALAARKK